VAQPGGLTLVSAVHLVIRISRAASVGERTKRCVGLIAGTSDPYVKFKVGGKTVYRSRTVMRNLNPRWDEKLSVMLDDLDKLIDVRVYDYDRGLRDDWMGSAAIQPAQLPLNVYDIHPRLHTSRPFTSPTPPRKDTNPDICRPPARV